MLIDINKIINWKDLISIALIQFFVKCFFLRGFGFETSLTCGNFFLLVLSTLLIVLGSFFITFYFIKKNSLKVITKKQLFFWYSILSLLGITAGTYISFEIEKPSYSFIFVFLSLSTLFYAMDSTRKTLMNNIIPSFLKSSSIVLVWWIDSPVSLSSAEWEIFLNLELIIIYYIAVSFAGNFIKSIVVDLKNIKVDNYNNQETLPIVFGEEKAKTIILRISLVIILTTTMMMFYFINNIYISIIILLLICIPQIYCFLKLKKAKTKKDYKYLIKGIDFILFLGILSMPLISYYIKHVIL
ncbi:hypothetical protein C7447_102186 [Tenacibaculum adriaticum]|uniref:UbiA prenyltransferase family protein n=1 Tax=Tenacibaculum adriaticum TaxID=413713 RepID=A0A5S5DU23_9FLAO|nr:hypothetical protein [Tenacibaculum adriaticum]TYP98868.1 hypothetical protein C7447_102186 [Tenacibaculum adriaticum]